VTSAWQEIRRRDFLLRFIFIQICGRTLAKIISERVCLAMAALLSIVAVLRPYTIAFSSLLLQGGHIVDSFAEIISSALASAPTIRQNN
jgi:hypothetical protein